MVENSRNSLPESSGGEEPQIKVCQGQAASGRFYRRTFPCLFQLMVAASNPGVPWLLDDSSLYTAVFPLSLLFL